MDRTLKELYYLILKHNLIVKHQINTHRGVALYLDRGDLARDYINPEFYPWKLFLTSIHTDTHYP